MLSSAPSNGLANYKIDQEFTSYSNPKGNTGTERICRTMKEELLWLYEWNSLFELADALSSWIINHIKISGTYHSGIDRQINSGRNINSARLLSWHRRNFKRRNIYSCSI